MTPAERQSALEALERSPGWRLVTDHLDEMARQYTAKLLGITGPAGTAEAPVWATRAKLAASIARWPVEEVEKIKRTREQGAAMADDHFGSDEGTTQEDLGDAGGMFDTGQVTPQGPVLDYQEPAQEEDEGGDWRSQIDDPDLREKVGGKYQSPTELARAYAESQRKLGEQGEDIRRLREEMQDLMAGSRNPQPNYGQMPTNEQQGQSGPTFEQLEAFTAQQHRAVQQGEIDPDTALANITYAQQDVFRGQMESMRESMRAEMEQTLSQSLAPVNDFQTQQAVGGDDRADAPAVRRRVRHAQGARGRPPARVGTLRSDLRPEPRRRPGRLRPGRGAGVPALAPRRRGAHARRHRPGALAARQHRPGRDGPAGHRRREHARERGLLLGARIPSAGPAKVYG